MTRRCGFCAIIGAPNAGKSTLINALVGSKVAIVTPKVQTTRMPVRGIAIAGDVQDFRFFEEGRVKFHGLFGIVVEPQKWCDLLDLGFSFPDFDVGYPPGGVSWL